MAAVCSDFMVEIDGARSGGLVWPWYGMAMVWYGLVWPYPDPVADQLQGGMVPQLFILGYWLFSSSKG